MSVKFQGDMLNFCDFIQASVFTTNHHLKGTLIKNEHSLLMHLTIGAVATRLKEEET